MTGFLREDDDGVADFLRDKEDKLALDLLLILALTLRSVLKVSSIFATTGSELEEKSTSLG